MSGEDGDWEGSVADCLTEACLDGLNHGVGVAIEWLLEFDGFCALDAADVPVGCYMSFMGFVCRAGQGGGVLPRMPRLVVRLR